MELLELEKRERKVDVDSKEGEEDESDSADLWVSELSKRVWWRLERRSSIDWRFFWRDGSATRRLELGFDDKATSSSFSIDGSNVDLRKRKCAESERKMREFGIWV